MTMKIALTNLGKYNEGVLDFVWLDLPATEDEIAQAFDAIEVSHDDVTYYSDGLGHTTDNDMYGVYEEFFISDYECDFMSIGEYDNLEELNEIAEKVEECDDPDLLTAIMDELGYDVDQALDALDSVITYPGCNDMTDVAYHYVDEGLIDIPDHLRNYFDYEAFGRDMEFDGSWFSYDDGMACIPY